MPVSIPMEELVSRLPPEGRAALSEARLRPGRLARLMAMLLSAEAFVLGRNVFLSRRAVRLLASRSPAGLALLAHELAHVEQFLKIGTWRFLFRYALEYFAARGRGRSHAEAYAAITFEREATERAAALRSAVSRKGSPDGPPRGA